MLRDSSLSTPLNAESLAPVGRGAPFVVRLQRGRVVLSLVAELGPPGLEPAAVPYQPLPIVMAGHVPQMAEQRAVRFGQRGAARLAPSIVGLLHVDDSVRMAGDHRCAAGHLLQQVEEQTALRVVVDLAAHRQIQADQRGHQPALRQLDALPPQRAVLARRRWRGRRSLGIGGCSRCRPA